MAYFEIDMMDILTSLLACSLSSTIELDLLASDAVVSTLVNNISSSR